VNDREAGKRLERFLRGKLADLGLETWDDLADRADIGRDSLARWRNKGQLPGAVAGAKLARAVGLTYSELLDIRDGKPGPETRTFTDSALVGLMARAAEMALEMQSQRARESGRERRKSPQPEQQSAPRQMPERRNDMT
jgi:transcriptional regulator with XRE-family HTH domain